MRWINTSVGVQRQYYSGPAGPIEACRVGVFLALGGSRGRALIDRSLYLPKSWCTDEKRLRKAGVPPEVGFATKPQLARLMIGRALDASGGPGIRGGGLRPRWVLADEVYGSDSKTRRFLESRDQPYMLAVTDQQRLWVDLQQQRVDHIGQDTDDDQWQRMSVGEGAKGPRLTDPQRALAWSVWRWRHQAIARRCHYRARAPDQQARL
jgi:SRSO17 transposase